VTAPVYVLACEQGATFEQVLTLSNPDTTEFNLTGCHATMTISPSYGASSPLVLSDTGMNPGIVLSVPNASITVTLTAAQTAAFTGFIMPIPQATYVFDLDLTKADGSVVRLMKGQLVVAGSVATA
jgi:hypothetical protein